MKTFTVVLLSLASIPAMAFASNNDAVPETWTGSGELGLAFTSGNTDSQTALGKLNLTRVVDDSKTTAGSSFLFGKSDGRKSADRVDAYATTGRRIGERSYAFGNVRGERDSFSSFDYQAVTGAGIGHELIKNDLTEMTVELGPSYRRSKSTDDEAARNELIARSKMNFTRKLNEGTSVYSNLLIESGNLNRFAQNNSGVQVKMTDNMALKAGVEVRYNSDVLPGIKKTDTLSTVNLQFGF